MDREKRFGSVKPPIAIAASRQSPRLGSARGERGKGREGEEGQKRVGIEGK